MSTNLFGAQADESGRDVRSPKTAELLSRRLRRMIASGELKDGDYLPREADLMAHFGVSRPTLREAVRVLEAESLVEVRRGSRTGPRVTVPGPAMAARPLGMLLQLKGATVEEVLTARLGIEPLAAWLLADRASEESCRRLEEALEVARAAVDAGWPLGSAMAAFHLTVMEECGNRALLMMAGMLQEVLARHMNATTRLRHETDPEAEQRNYRRALRAYQKLIQLVRAGRADEAAEFWRRYLEAANTTLLTGVEGKAVIDAME